MTLCLVGRQSHIMLASAVTRLRTNVGAETLLRVEGARRRLRRDGAPLTPEEREAAEQRRALAQAAAAARAKVRPWAWSREGLPPCMWQYNRIGHSWPCSPRLDMKTAPGLPDRRRTSAVP